LSADPRPLIEVFGERPDWARALRQSTEDVTAARQAAADEDTAWRYMIRAALADGVPVVEVAELTGISRARVYQIRDGRR
jgi:hypothetical protein